MTDIYTAPHYSQARNWPLEFFTPAEVADSRDGSVKLYVPFGRRMDELRRAFGSAIIVNSWYRTYAHDADIGGKGNHTGGWAADIRPANGNFYGLARLAFEFRFKGIGIARSFIHLDDNHDYDQQGKRPALWIY